MVCMSVLGLYDIVTRNYCKQNKSLGVNAQFRKSRQTVRPLSLRKKDVGEEWRVKLVVFARVNT